MILLHICKLPTGTSGISDPPPPPFVKTPDPPRTPSRGYLTSIRDAVSREDGAKASLTQEGAKSVFGLESCPILATYASGGEEIRVAVYSDPSRDSRPHTDTHHSSPPNLLVTGEIALTWRLRGGYRGRRKPLQRLGQHGGGAA